MQEMKRHGFDPWVGKIPWRRKWQPAPVFLPGEFHGQRNLASYSPWDCEEAGTTERIHPHTAAPACRLLWRSNGFIQVKDSKSWPALRTLLHLHQPHATHPPRHGLSLSLPRLPWSVPHMAAWAIFIKGKADAAYSPAMILITHRKKSTLLVSAHRPLLYPICQTFPCPWSRCWLPHWLLWWDPNTPSSFGPRGLHTFCTHYLLCFSQLFLGLAPSRQSGISLLQKALAGSPGGVKSHLRVPLVSTLSQPWPLCLSIPTQPDHSGLSLSGARSVSFTVLWAPRTGLWLCWSPRGPMSTVTHTHTQCNQVLLVPFWVALPFSLPPSWGGLSQYVSLSKASPGDDPLGEVGQSFSHCPGYPGKAEPFPACLLLWVWGFNKVSDPS